MSSSSSNLLLSRAARCLRITMLLAGVAACAGPASHLRPQAPPLAAARNPATAIRLGAEVDGLAAADGSVWAYVRDAGVLIRVDQRTSQVRRFPLSRWRGMPVVIAAGSGGLWLANQHSTRPDLSRIDRRTGRIVARPHLPSRFGPITGMTAAFGAVWILVPDAASMPGWRVLRLDPSTDRIDGISPAILGTQFTGHTAAIWASAGRVWVTGSMRTIVSLNPRTLRTHATTTAGLTESLILGAGRAWGLSNSQPRLTVIDPSTGKVLRTFTVAAPSATGDDKIAVAPGMLWVFRGSLLTQVDPVSGQTISSARVDPLAPAFFTQTAVAGTSLWYLAQTSHGIALEHITRGRGR